MNEVSWRRILEQADNRQPFDRDSNVVHLQDRGAHGGNNAARPRPMPPGDDLPSLEAELRRAAQLEFENKAKRYPRKPPANRQPSPGQHAKQLQMRMQNNARPAATPPVPYAAAKNNRAKASGNGARNLIAISLSLAIVAFAGYQLTHNWEPNRGATNTQTASADPSENGSPAEETGTGSGGTPVTANFTGNRLDFRPSLANEASLTTQELNARLSPEPQSGTETTASIPATVEPAPAEAQQLRTQVADLNEAAILDRGREILERGHVSGARVIFEYLADRGSALGSFALAQTYDSQFIDKNELPEKFADEKLAEKWYRYAVELGGTKIAADQ